MLRRPPTAITLTAEDISSYEDRAAAEAHAHAIQAAQEAARLRAMQDAERATPQRGQNINPNSGGESGLGAPMKSQRDLERERIREREARMGMGGRG